MVCEESPYQIPDVSSLLKHVSTLYIVRSQGGSKMRFRVLLNVCFTLAAVLTVCLLVVQPILAERPPDGYARPPIHVRGNATKAPTGLSPSQVRHGYGFDQLSATGSGQTIAIVDAYDD